MNRIIITLIIINLAAVIMWDFLHTRKLRSRSIEPVVQTEKLSTFVEKLMGQCRANVSETRRAILSTQVARIAERTFQSREQQEAFVLLVCIESKFNSDAKSHAGAVGLSQLIPKYASEFSTQCELGKVTTSDLMDAEVNLTIGACQFRKLLISFNGNVGLALAAYNSGQYSETTKKAALLQEINPETSGYLAKFLILREYANN